MFWRLIYSIEKNFNLKRSFDIKKDINKEDLENYIKQGGVLIDVRSPQEFREGHFDGAISIPDYRIKREIEKEIPNKEEIIVLYCSTGHRSIRAQKIMKNMGYENVFNIYDGMIN